MDEEEQPKNSAGFQTPGQPDRSASGLQYQSYSLDTRARGVNGLGRRAAPDYSHALFSSPPRISGGQFGGGNAKSSFSAGPEED